MDISNFIENYSSNEEVICHTFICLYTFTIYLGKNSLVNRTHSSPDIILPDINNYITVSFQISDGNYNILSAAEEPKFGFDKLNLTKYLTPYFTNHMIYTGTTILQLEEAYNLIRVQQGLPRMIYPPHNTAVGLAALNANTTGNHSGPWGKQPDPIILKQTKTGGNCKKCKAWDKYAPLDNHGECLCYKCFGG